MSTAVAKLRGTVRWPSCRPSYWLSYWIAAIVFAGALGCATGSPSGDDDLCGNLLLDDGEMCDDGNTLETEISRVVQAWDEQVITWNNQPLVDTGSTVTVGPPSSSTADLQVDLTAMVNSWFSTPASNFGFRLKLQTEEHYRAVVLTSSDYLDDPLRRPSLTVKFSACP